MIVKTTLSVIVKTTLGEVDPSGVEEFKRTGKIPARWLEHRLGDENGPTLREALTNLGVDLDEAVV